MQNEYGANKRIRELRDHLGMGRGEFAEKTGIPKKTIENVEQEKQKAYAWHIEAIARIWPEYAYWITTGMALPEAGQISPEMEEARKKLDQVG
ncbi:MAG: helix-turn-helix domain-containing protein [Methylomicrobium sp.]